MSKFDCWQDADHTVLFDSRMFYPSFYLDQVYQSLNEFILAQKYLPSGEPFTFSDIGCATGEISRYFQWKYPKMSYTGYDISKVALKIKMTELDSMYGIFLKKNTNRKMINYHHLT